jgi:hypothetical protein
MKGPDIMAKTATRSRAKPLIFSGDSECFIDLRFSRGSVFATFAKDGSQYSYEMSRADAKEWFTSDSVGKFFNEEVR